MYRDYVMPWTSGAVCLVALILLARSAGAAAPVEVRIEDADSRPAADMAVYLLPADGQARLERAPRTAIMDQRGREFAPHLMVVQTGTEVRFANSDSVSHHVYSFSRPNDFEIPLYRGEARDAIRFETAGLITLGCNIHDQMLGFILVVDSPHFGVTGQDGLVSIAGVPAGTYQLAVWSPRMPQGTPWVADTILVSGVSDLQAYTYRVKERLGARRESSAESLSWEDY